MNKKEAVYLSHLLHLMPALVLLTAGVSYYRRFDVDDTFIYFVYVKNLLSGNGLTFNGSYVEGFSSVIWVFLLSVFSMLSDNMLLVAKIMSFAFAVANVVLLYAVAWKATGRMPLASLAALVFTASPIVSLWTAGALETQMFTFLFLLSANVLATSPGSRRTSMFAGAIFGLLAASRPEGFAIIGMVPVYYLYCRFGPERSRYSQRLIYSVFLGFTAFLLTWRYVLYASFLPNTVYAKSGPLLSSITREGLEYTLIFYRMHFLVITAIVLALNLVYSFRSDGNEYARRMSFLSVVSIAGYTAFIIVVNGDWMPGLRLYVAIMPFLGLSYALAVYYILSRNPRMSFKVLITAIPVFCVVLLAYRQYVPGELMKSEIYSLMGPDIRMERRIPPEVIRSIADNTSREDYVAVVDAGEIPYRINNRIIDMVGLNDRHIARLPGDFMQRFDNKYVLSFKPRMIQMHVSKSATGVPVPVNFIGSVELFYSDEFQKNYEMVEQGLFRRLERPRSVNMMTDYYNGNFRLSAKNVTDSMVYVDLINKGTGIWTAGTSSDKWGTMYVQYLVSDSKGTSVYGGIEGIREDIYPGDTSTIGLPLPDLARGLYYLQLNLVHFLSEENRPALKVTTLSFSR